MPRKVGPPPLVLRIESLSDGREIRPETFVSDFGEHETLPVKPDPRPARVMRSGDEILNEIKQRKIDAGVNMLKAIGIIPDDRPKPEPKPKPPEVKGQRAIARLGDSFAIMFISDPIRRW
jgi:hypothetical protein